MSDPYETLDATALAALVRSGEVSARELVDAAIVRVETLDPTLNALVHRQFERARGDADALDRAHRAHRSHRSRMDAAADAAPFAGVPFLLKDYRGREKGEPYCMGMRALRDAGFRPSSDSEVALRFRDAGLVPIGRTNVPEMALMGTTEPEAFGPTHNPWAPGRSPGGSSGGSAAAVGAGIVPAAHANDIAGSIRIPAAHCGLVGLKPTRSRLVTSTAADPPVGMFCEGVVTRSVRDTAALCDVLLDRSALGPWPAPMLEGPLAGEVGRPVERLRIGLCVDAFNGSEVDRGCADAARAAAALLERMGHSVDESSPAALFSDELAAHMRTLLAVHNAVELAAWSARLGRELGATDVEANTWAIVSGGRAVSGPALLEAMGRLQEITRDAMRWWRSGDRADGFDLLVTPTTAEAPPVLGDYTRNYAPGRASAFTRVFNATGQPAISLPLGWPPDGLPRGVQLIAAYGRDDLLVRVAAALEDAAPWAGRRPPLRMANPRP